MAHNSWDVCNNCGGERGLHHYQTMQCPVGGREAPIGRKQEWMTTTFEIEQPAELAALRARVEELEAGLQEIENNLDDELGEWCSVSFFHIPESFENIYQTRDIARDLLEQVQS